MIDKNRITSNLSILLVCILLGFAISIQFKTVQVNTNQSARVEEFQQMYLSEQIKNKSLQDQISQMQTTIDTYRDSIEQTGSAHAGMEADLLRAENLAGLTDVYGPGISITLTESKNVDPSSPLSLYIIHDRDLRSLVNELLVAGAEAVAINGERVVSTTAIRCVGSVVTVNDVRYAAPYTITAIGEPTTLYNALTMLGGIESELKSYNIDVSIQKKERIDIKAYTGKVTFQYVTTAKN